MYASGVSERRKLKTQTRTEAVNYTAAHFALIITHYLFTARKKACECKYFRKSFTEN